jgi:hypothetical protein
LAGWLGAAACATFALPDALVLELELPIAKPPTATATAAAPAAMDLVSLLENMEDHSSWFGGGYTEGGAAY